MELLLDGERKQIYYELSAYNNLKDKWYEYRCLVCSGCREIRYGEWNGKQGFSCLRCDCDYKEKLAKQDTKCPLRYW